MTDTAPAAAREPRRGREARRSARAKALARLHPLHHPQDPADRNGQRGRARDDRAQRRDAAQEVGIEFREFPRALELFRGAGCDIKGERVRFPRGLARQPLRHHAVAICAARAQSRAQRADRRRRDGVRAELRLALRPRPRQRPPLRHARRLPEFREARLSQPVHPPFRRHGVRAGRSAGQQAAFRDGLRASQIFGQAVHGLGDQARARRGQRAHLRASVWRGLRPREHGA